MFRNFYKFDFLLIRYITQVHSHKPMIMFPNRGNKIFEFNYQDKIESVASASGSPFKVKSKISSEKAVSDVQLNKKYHRKRLSADEINAVQNGDVMIQ